MTGMSCAAANEHQEIRDEASRSWRPYCHGALRTCWRGPCSEAVLPPLAWPCSSPARPRPGKRNARPRVPREEPLRRLYGRRCRRAGGHQLPQHGDRALGRRQPCGPQEPDRRLAAGPLGQRRRPRARGRLQQGRRPDLDQVGAPGRDRLRRRHLRARVRPVGEHLAQRHRLLHEPGVRPRPAERLLRRQRHAGQPVRPTAALPGATRSR